MNNAHRTRTLTVESVAFPLGYIFSPQRVRFVPPSYRHIDGFSLFVHAHTRVSVATLPSGVAVILVGIAISGEEPDLTHQALASKLGSALQMSDEAFLGVADDLVGRFAVIFRDIAGVWRAVNDAIGIRTVFHARDAAASFVGSHLELVARQLTTMKRRNPITAKWGYPGLRTPYTDITLLVPNHFLDLATGDQKRYFPTSPIMPATAIEAASFCARIGRNVIGALSKQSQLAVSITAGKDSRATLALSLDQANRIDYFTYRTHATNHDVDVALGEELCRASGVKHEILNFNDPLPALDNRAAYIAHLNLNCSFEHQRPLIRRYIEAFGQWDRVHLRSNLYELGRASFQMHHPKHRPDTPAAATAFYILYGGKRVIPHKGAILEAFEELFDVADWRTALKYIDASDLFFIEHRMPTWQANVILESDCAWETMIILNSRNCIRKMLGITVEERGTNALFDGMIRAHAPKLLSYPYNPPAWLPALAN